MEDDAKFAKKVISLIAETVPRGFRKSAITLDMRLQRDLGLDSIAMLSLVFRFEEAFGIDLSSLDLPINLGQMRTVGDAIDMGRAIVRQAKAAGI